MATDSLHGASSLEIRGARRIWGEHAAGLWRTSEDADGHLFVPANACEPFRQDLTSELNDVEQLLLFDECAKPRRKNRYESPRERGDDLVLQFES